MDAYHNYWFHIKASCLGMLLGLPACLTAGAGYLAHLHNTFSYDGKRKLSKTIVEGVASYVTVPDGGKCLDVGCGSGSNIKKLLTKCSKGTVKGIDYSEISVEKSRKVNAKGIAARRHILHLQ